MSWPTDGNAIAADTDISGEPRIAGAVDDAAAANQEVVGRLLGGEREARQDRGNERGKTLRLDVERGCDRMDPQMIAPVRGPLGGV